MTSSSDLINEILVLNNFEFKSILLKILGESEFLGKYQFFINHLKMDFYKFFAKITSNISHSHPSNPPQIPKFFIIPSIFLAKNVF
jgi:hypothetical protein